MPRPKGLATPSRREAFRLFPQSFESKASDDVPFIRHPDDCGPKRPGCSGEMPDVQNGPERPLTQFEDHELIALCLDGDDAAWEILIRRYQRLVYSIPLKAGLGEESAADVFQSVCVRLIEHLGSLKDRGKL